MTPMFRLIGHVPLVTLPPGSDTYQLPPGRLRAVPFEEWSSFDDSFPYRQRHYERTSPTFFELDVKPTEGSEEAVERFTSHQDEGTRDLNRCHMALLLVTAARLPAPDISVVYLVIDGGDLPIEMPEDVLSVHYARVGPGQRELIVHGDQHTRIALDGDSVRISAQASQLLAAVGLSVEPVLAALVRTTRPGFSALNEAIHLVAGLEAVLVARGEPLAATFARRYAILAADDDPEPLHEQARKLYALRSDLLHGRPLSTDGVETRDYFLQYHHRHWTCSVTLRALQWLAANENASVATLRQRLDLAWNSPAALDELRSTWTVADD
jgi:hypothetical protein